MTISRRANRKYPSIPQVTQDLANHANILQLVKEGLEIAQRRTGDVGDSFVRVSEFEEELALLRPRYGAFHDMTRQTAALANTAYAVTFGATDLSFGVRLGAPTSRVIIDKTGVYDFQFSAQVDKTSGGKSTIYFWPRVDGIDVPESMSHFRIQGNDDEVVPAWNFVLSMTAGSYFELMWAVADTAVVLETFVATAFGPATPSVILTVNQVGT